MKPSPSAVAAVVSPTAKIGLLRCSLASASARAPLALVSSTAWQAASAGGEIGGRMQDLQAEQRRDHRLVAALGRAPWASAAASRSGRVISTRISSP